MKNKIHIRKSNKELVCGIERTWKTLNLAYKNILAMEWSDVCSKWLHSEYTERQRKVIPTSLFKIHQGV